jgi:hypothetical protein
MDQALKSKPLTSHGPDEHIGVTAGTFKPWGRVAVNVGAIRNRSSAMSIISLHLQRRFERRWAARFRSLVIPAVAKNVGLKGSPVNMRRARQKPKKNPSG